MVNHPIAYAIVGAFAVAFVVYEFLTSRQKPQRQSSSRRPPSPPRRPPSPPDCKPDNKPGKANVKPPDDKSGKPSGKPDDKSGKLSGKPDNKSKETTGKPGDKPGKSLENSPKSNSSPFPNNENSVRHRTPHSERLNESKQEESNTTVLKSNPKNPILSPEEDKKVSDSKGTLPASSSFVKNELQDSSLNDFCNQKMDVKNYEKNVFDRLANEAKCINKDPKEEKKLNKNNILEDSKSDSEADSESDSDNDFFQEVLDSGRTDAEASHQAVCPSEDSQNKKNQKKEDQMKEAYKLEVTDKLKRDIEDGDGETAAVEIALDVVNVEEVRSRISNNMEQNKCSGCEQMPCNAVALPCEHCYLCKDCAKVVLRCSPKCSICLADIRDFR